MTQAFSKFGVTTDHLERYLGHKLDQTLVDEIVDLTGIFNAIKEGTPASEFFAAEQQADKNEKTAAGITAAAQAGNADQKAQQEKEQPQGGPVADAKAAKAQKAKAAAAAEAESKPAEKESKPAEEQPTAVVEAQPKPDDSDDDSDSQKEEDVF
jgi:type IV secretory pathway VirB10-like protein